FWPFNPKEKAAFWSLPSPAKIAKATCSKGVIEQLGLALIVGAGHAEIIGQGSAQQDPLYDGLGKVGGAEVLRPLEAQHAREERRQVTDGEAHLQPTGEGLTKA